MWLEHQQDGCGMRTWLLLLVRLTGTAHAVPLQGEQVKQADVVAPRHEPERFTSDLSGPLEGVERVTRRRGADLLQRGGLVRHVFAPILLVRVVVQTTLILLNPT